MTLRNIKTIDDPQKNRLYVDISGAEGNPFCLLRTAEWACRNTGKDFIEMKKRLLSGSYENLLIVFDEEFGDEVDLYRGGEKTEVEPEPYFQTVSVEVEIPYGNFCLNIQRYCPFFCEETKAPPKEKQPTCVLDLGDLFYNPKGEVEKPENCRNRECVKTRSLSSMDRLREAYKKGLYFWSTWNPLRNAI